MVSQPPAFYILKLMDRKAIIETYGRVSAGSQTHAEQISFSGPGIDATYAYRCNGKSIGQFGCESDRVSQTVNGVTTNYVLDSASPLTQVLQDGTNTYVYGVDRIAQINGTIPEYFLTDGLGSVRQLVDSNGTVTLAKSYQPYGTEASSVGSGSSSYAFTGEMADPTGLIYLRARYYASETGRFITRDLWAGDYNRPLSLNRWSYVMGNPILYSDPAGLFAIEDIWVSFGLSNGYELAELFQTGGTLQGKWGYLKFLEWANWGGPGESAYGLYDENGFVDENNQWPGSGRFYRPDVSSNPCPPMAWYLKPGNGCYVKGSMISAGWFDVHNNSIVWIDATSGRRMSLMELGRLNVDWYGKESGSQLYYAYEWYPVAIDYDFRNVDKLSLSANVAEILSPCVLTCPLNPGGPICALGLISSVYAFFPGIIDTTRNFDRLDMNDTSAIDDIAIDGCSNVPVYGFFCGVIGTGSDLKEGVVYPVQK